MNRMCTDPSVYEVDAYWKSQGVNTEEQVRHEVLWRAASRGEVPIHTGTCKYCAELYASFERLSGALDSDTSLTLAVCPDAEAFSRYYYGEKNEAIAEHVKICSACKEDLAFLARSQEPRERTLPLQRRLMWLAAAAAALIFTLLPWPWNQKPNKIPPRSFQQSSQYASLAVPPEIDRAELMAVSAADHHSRIEQVIGFYEKGDYKQAERVADIIYRAVDDPAAAYLMGMAEYKQGNLKDALEAMRASEATSPVTGYRCWGTLQLALMLGDKETIRRELKHVTNESAYHDRCVQLSQKLGNI
jgi:hypothetical protein